MQKCIVFEIKRFPYPTPPYQTLWWLANFQHFTLNLESLLYTEFASNQFSFATQYTHMPLLSNRHDKLLYNSFLNIFSIFFLSYPSNSTISGHFFQLQQPTRDKPLGLEPKQKFRIISKDSWPVWYACFKIILVCLQYRPHQNKHMHPFLGSLLRGGGWHRLPKVKPVAANTFNSAWKHLTLRDTICWNSAQVRNSCTYLIKWCNLKKISNF